jgi:hypothetical protein
LLVFLIVVPARAQLLDRFVAEYQSAASRLDKIYDQVAIDAVESQFADDGTLIQKSHCEYLRDDKFIRKVQTVVQSNDTAMPIGSMRAMGGSRENYFNIRKRSDDASPFITDYGPRSKEDFSFKTRIQCAPVFAICCGGATDMREYITMPTVRLVSATLVVLDGQKAVDVLAHQLLPGGSRDTHLYFMPENWAFCGMSMILGPIVPPGSDPRQTMEIRVVYDEGNPLKLTSIHSWRTVPSVPKLKIDEHLIKVESIKFVPTPASEFRLAALGVEEPGSVHSGSSFRRSFLLNAIVLVLLGVGLAVFAARKRRAA